MHPVLGIALLLFCLFLLFYVVQSIFLLYHLLKFSVQPDSARLFAAAFFGISLLLLTIATFALARASWSTPFFFPDGTTVFSTIR